MAIAIRAAVLLIGGGIAFLGLFIWWASSGRYPQSRYAEVITYGETAPPSDPTLTLVSYNIGYLSGLANAALETDVAVSSSRESFDANQERAIASLQAVNPDIVTIQEVDLEARRSYKVNQVAALAEGLGMANGAIAINWDKRYVPFPYWPITQQFGRTLSGQSILSRFPIQNHERHVLDRVAGNNWIYNAFYLDRLAQVAEVVVGEATLVVINVHLEAFDYDTRQKQTDYVVNLAETYAEDYPVVLLGDFNSALNRPEEGEPFTIQTLLDSEVFAPVVPVEALTEPEQFTFPSNQPQYKLDYGFYTPETLEVIETQVLTSAGTASDHLPLMMRLQLR